MEGRESSTVAWWLPRIVGAVLLVEQGVAHLLVRQAADFLILGVGLFLLAGKEGVEFLRLVLGRGDG